MPLHFTPRTFSYFTGARRHSRDRAWFDAHRALYDEHVALPFTHLIHQLGDTLAPLLPGISFSPRRLSKPLLRQSKDPDGPLLRPTITITLAEPSESMFESNPAFYLSLGANPEDNILACGLYEPSSRQLRALRPSFYADHTALTALLAAPKLRRHWGSLAGPRYQRFPRGLDPTAPGADFAAHKQFFLTRQPTREQICDPAFPDRVTTACRAAVPFLTWTRRTVGVYRRTAAAATPDW